VGLQLRERLAVAIGQPVEQRAPTRVGERPEFEGTKIEELKDLIEGSVFRLSKTQKLDDVLASLRSRLPRSHLEPTRKDQRPPVDRTRWRSSRT